MVGTTSAIFLEYDSYSGGRGQPMKRLGLAVIFAAVIEVALQVIGGAVVIGADDALQPLITTSEIMVGQNRFRLWLAKRGKLIEHADVLVLVRLKKGSNLELANTCYDLFNTISELL